MMETNNESKKGPPILTGKQAQELSLAAFEGFPARPVNYFRGIVRESEECLMQLTEDEVARRIDRRLEAEHATFANEQEKAYRSGFEKGVVKGREEGEQQIVPALELLHEWGRVLQAEKEELARRYEGEVVELAFLISEKILGTEIATRPEAVVDVARQALKKIVKTDEVVLRVHPDDQEVLERARDELSREANTGKALELRADNSVTRGGCVIETESGMLNAQLDSQVNRLRTLLKEVPSGEDK